MIELLTGVGPPQGVVEQVAFIEEVGRVVSFRLAPGGAVPETCADPLLIVAATDLDLEAGDRSGEARRIQLQAGQAQLLSNGVAGLANLGAAEARFTLIDLPRAE
jgi:hypothetical protein